jgi:glutamine phosphoribosylpyrophosphate amidotransferase
MCGILGLLLHDPALNAAPEICEGLSLLQHRGQDACGIVTGGPRGRLYQCKANGMVRDVFTQDAIARLIGGMGIGHGEHPHIFTTTILVVHHPFPRTGKRDPLNVGMWFQFGHRPRAALTEL